MTKAVLKLRPGPFIGSGRLSPEAWTALALLPWLAILAINHLFWPFLTPLAALIFLLLAPKPSQGQKRPWAEAALFSILTTVILGPGAGPISFAIAGCLLAILTVKIPLFRHPFIPAALVGLLIEFALNIPALSQGIAPETFLGTLSGTAPETFLGILSGYWLLTLVPAALAALWTARQTLASALIPLALWSFAALVLVGLKKLQLDWAWGLIWMTLAFHLGREFSPIKNSLPGVILVSLAGLAAFFGLLAILLALTILGAWEIALSLRSLRRSKRLAAGDPRLRNYPENPDLVAIRLCGREKAAGSLVYQGPPGCRLAAALDGGPEDCPEGCLTFGDCVTGCPHEAIKPAEPGYPPKLDKARCRGCGACLEVCPKGLMVLRPRQAPFVVSCRGSAKLKDMDRLCPVGCLKCGRCRKACPAGAIDRLGLLAPPTVADEICQQARPDCALACRSACPRHLPAPAMGHL